MKTPQLYTILSHLHDCMEVINSVVKQDKGGLSKLIGEASDHIGGAFVCVETELSDRMKGSDERAVDHIENVVDTAPTTKKPTNAELLEQAYDILKTESKPGPTLVQNQLNITQSLARKLVKKLFDSGRLVKGERAVGPSKDGEIEEAPTKKVDPNRPEVMDLIDKLPIGDDLLVSKHLQPLLMLPRTHRAIYLSGLELKDQFDSTDIKRVTAKGLDSTLVDEIVELCKTKPIKVNDSELITINKAGTPQEQKYFKLRGQYIASIDKGFGQKVGADLYRHMVKSGLTMRLLADIKYIATQYNGGKV